MTSLADIEWTLIETVRDALEACGACDADSIDAYRYNCGPPADCCSECGTLTAWWSSLGPVPSPDRRCVSKMQATVNVRFLRCWPCVSDDGKSIPSIAVQDAAAEAMTDDATCALQALLALACDSPCGDMRVLEVTPVCPLGCCSGFIARVVVHPTPPVPPVPEEATP